MKILQSMNMKELSEIAKEKGLALSYKAESGVRKRYTKEELIANISKEKPVEKLPHNHVKTEEKELDLNLLPINKIVLFARQSIKKGNIKVAEKLIDIVQTKIVAERINSFEVTKMNNVLNVLKSLVRINRKLVLK